MKQLFKFYFAFILTYNFFGIQAAHAGQELTFPEVWSAFQKNSKLIQSTEEQFLSLKKGEERAARHWWPSLYINAQSFYTNDPGSILFSKLGERNITGADFNPAVMNFPSATRHEKMDLGARWMLYEGGVKSSLSMASEYLKESKDFEKKSQLSAEYSKALQNYGQLLIIRQSRARLLPLQESVLSTLKRYQIGQSSNPLGYSGLLGLKSLKNRIYGEILMLEAKKKSIISEFTKKAALPEDWTPEVQTLNEYINKNIHWDKEQINQKSYAVLAQEKGSFAIDKYAQAEKANYLPHVGLFAENQIYNNSETTHANSYTVGAFVKWNLYEPTQRGSVDQVALLAKAQVTMAEGVYRDQGVMFSNIENMKSVIAEQLKLVEESLNMMEEQTQVSQKLFNSGLINALQLTEIYSKRVEVIVARTQLEENLLQLNAQQLQLIPYSAVQ